MNVVICVLVVLCELHVTRVVVVDAVVGLTLGLIAHVIVVVFVVAILHRIFCIWRYTLYNKSRRVQSCNRGSELFVACSHCATARGQKPRRGDEFPPVSHASSNSDFLCE